MDGDDMMDKKELKVLFCYKNFAIAKGISHIGLGVSHMHTSNTLRNNGIWSKAIPILSVEDLRKEIDKIHPTHVIIAALWIHPTEIHKLVYDYHDVQFVVTCHSNVGFLSAEPQAISHIKSLVGLQLSIHNFQMVGNCKRFSDWASYAFGFPFLMLPNLYNAAVFKTPRVHRHDLGRGGTIKIGCFGALRHLKNIFTAAAAALEMAERLGIHVDFHTNNKRGCEGILTPIESLFEGSRCKLTRIGWQPWSEFRTTIGRMDLLMQPSFTESFNLVVADGVAEGIPSVVGESIDWVPAKWRSRSDDAHHFASTGIQLVYDSEAPHEGQEALLDYVAVGLRHWFKYFGV